ncbi:hypothetical protein QJS10_CPA06g01447 [Acorus calamus]|uniref:Uncharacterized protein n=1 Tax=Acorus calamus TaxID=4465 RepID=A0AAV9EPY0_ACOCL|nr:hypothetical protein QJS10_CPA06g01447 [Acorus calamus]
MGSMKTWSSIFFLILLAFAALRSNGADASRVLIGCDGGGDDERVGSSSYLAYPTMYKKARSSVVQWMGRLSAGPSPGGQGH